MSTTTPFPLTHAGVAAQVAEADQILAEIADIAQDLYGTCALASSVDTHGNSWYPMDEGIETMLRPRLAPGDVAVLRTRLRTAVAEYLAHPGHDEDRRVDDATIRL